MCLTIADDIKEDGLSIEEPSNCVDLHLNTGKTKTLLVNIPPTSSIQTLDGTKLKTVSDLKYLGSSLPDSFQDFKCRKAHAWSTCNKLDKIWKSDLDRAIKIKFFRACVESILLYGAKTWTTTQKMNDRINGCYTQLLRRVLNIHWRDHTTNSEVYGNLTPLSETIMQRRLQFAGHCLRTADQPISHLVFWNPPGGHPNRGRRKMSYTDTSLDTQISIQTRLNNS
ncbi:uncharacterized protein [Asterias amurensis]|uniref:uncharacterized protein n=1 Tax=Asterias amurensis TaxID=7602 RepID=UPI003AB26C1A